MDEINLWDFEGPKHETELNSRNFVALEAIVSLIGSNLSMAAPKYVTCFINMSR